MLFGRSSPQGRWSSNDKGRVSCELFISLGKILEKQDNVWDEIEQAYRNAISFNTRYSKSYKLFLEAIVKRARSVSRHEWQKLGKKGNINANISNNDNEDKEICNENIIISELNEGKKKIHMAMTLARAAGAATDPLEHAYEEALGALLDIKPHLESQLFCHNKLFLE